MTAQTECQITLPWPPSANHYLAHTSRGTYLKPEAKAYHSTVEHIARVAGIVSEIADGQRIAVRLDCYPPDHRKRDLGNVEKVLLDSLTRAGVWPDDSQIDDLRITRQAVGRGEVDITIKVIRN